MDGFTRVRGLYLHKRPLFSGDYCMIDEEGDLFIIDRINDLMDIDGKKARSRNESQ